MKPHVSEALLFKCYLTEEFLSCGILSHRTSFINFCDLSLIIYLEPALYFKNILSISEKSVTLGNKYFLAPTIIKTLWCDLKIA